MIFEDRNGNVFNLKTYGHSAHLKTQTQVKAVLDRSTSVEGLKELHPTWPDGLHERIAASYAKASYIHIMDSIGFRYHAILIGRKGDPK